MRECIKNVPAYKNYAFLKNDIEKDPIYALKQIPILNKKDFREKSESYVNQTASKSNLIQNCTGGSTGEPVKFYIDRKTVEYYEAARWRGLSWWGITPGSRSVMIWGNPIELNQMKQKKYSFKEKWLKNRIIIPAYSLKPDSMKNYIKKITSYKPEYFYGYASALYAFSKLMLQQNLKLAFNPKAVVSTAETLHNFQREVIQKAFGCPVVNEYGARDAGILAYQCNCGNMHISCENVFFEVVDTKTLKPLPAGKSGLLLVTDLNNFSMPRLRYQLGDRVIMSEKVCECGIGLPILEKIDGREDDIFVTVDGVLVHGHVFNHKARSLNSIQKFQIIQKSPSYAELSLVLNKNYNEEEVDKFIEDVQKLLPKTNIAVKIVDKIPVSNSGKFRYAIRTFEI